MAGRTIDPGNLMRSRATSQLAGRKTAIKGRKAWRGWGMSVALAQVITRFSQLGIFRIRC